MGAVLGPLPPGMGLGPAIPTLNPITSSHPWAYFLLRPPLKIVTRLPKMTWAKIPLQGIENEDLFGCEEPDICLPSGISVTLSFRQGLVQSRCSVSVE